MSITHKIKQTLFKTCCTHNHPLHICNGVYYCPACEKYSEDLFPNQDINDPRRTWVTLYDIIQSNPQISYSNITELINRATVAGTYSNIRLVSDNFNTMKSLYDAAKAFIKTIIVAYPNNVGKFMDTTNNAIIFFFVFGETTYKFVYPFLTQWDEFGCTEIGVPIINSTELSKFNIMDLAVETEDVDLPADSKELAPPTLIDEVERTRVEANVVEPVDDRDWYTQAEVQFLINQLREEMKLVMSDEDVAK